MDSNLNRGSEPGAASVVAKPRMSAMPVVTTLMVLSIVGFLILLFLPAVRKHSPAPRRNTCLNKLRQIAIALQSYENEYRALPPAYTIDADGKPLHSRRTLILPYLDQQKLYESIDLTKPWDDLVNAKARETSLSMYQCPSMHAPAGNTTTYLAVVTPKSGMLSNKPRSLAEITDGTSKTLLVIEVDTDHSVPWMSPVDADEHTVLGIGPNSNMTHNGGMFAAFVDGHVMFLPYDLPAERRRALISSAENDKAPDESAY